MSCGACACRYANAGHPAPLVLTPDGELLRLDEQRSPLIGAVRGRGRMEAQVRCADERTDIRERTAGVSAEEAVERVVVVCLPAELRDDVALLVVGLEG